MRYAKILENGSLEYAPRNIDGVSNWIEDVDAVKAAGYLHVSEEVIPQGYVVSGWEIKDGEIVQILEKIPEPTKEEQRQAREDAYIADVDPITCHINRLKDEEQTPEVIAEIASLVEERKAKVAEIKARFPYPVEETEPVVKESNSSDSVLSEASENKGQSEPETEEVI